jgi:hypothetical protein
VAACAARKQSHSSHCEVCPVSAPCIIPS